MYTLKGIFPEPKKDDQKKNFIRENMKQLKNLQAKGPSQPKLQVRKGTTPTTQNVNGKTSLNNIKSPTSKKQIPRKKGDVIIKKGDMAEFLKRKEMRKQVHEEEFTGGHDLNSTASSGQLRDIACQTVESNLAQSFADNAKLTILYPKKDEQDSTQKACGDMSRHRADPRIQTQQRAADLFEPEKRSRLNAILERNRDKDPYLPSVIHRPVKPPLHHHHQPIFTSAWSAPKQTTPDETHFNKTIIRPIHLSGYQKGVLPKYLRERKEQELKVCDEGGAEEGAVCPPGHVTLPDVERKETLRMLRNSFAELVNELNKMPVKTDTLRMRNRKMELEKQLAKLEEGIKVFSRPKVFVKIGE